MITYRMLCLLFFDADFKNLIKSITCSIISSGRSFASLTNVSYAIKTHPFNYIHISYTLRVIWKYSHNTKYTLLFHSFMRYQLNYNKPILELVRASKIISGYLIKIKTFQRAISLKSLYFQPFKSC